MSGQAGANLATLIVGALIAISFVTILMRTTSARLSVRRAHAGGRILPELDADTTVTADERAGRFTRDRVPAARTGRFSRAPAADEERLARR